VQQFQHAQSVGESGYFNQPQLTSLLDQAHDTIAREDQERAAAARAAAAAQAEQQREAERQAELQRQAEARRQSIANWAVVYRDDKNKFYRRINQANLEAAKEGTELDCYGDPDSRICTFVASFRDACFSLARDRDGWGWSTKPTLSEAISNALSQCQAKNSGCVTKWSWCSNGN
jgi:hypothetical protein